MLTTGVLTSTFHVTNIHCPSCVTYAKDVMSTFSNSIYGIDTSIVDHTIRVQHTPGFTDALLTELTKAAFEVEHVTIQDADGKVVRDRDVQATKSKVSRNVFAGLFMSKAQKQHIQNCNSCQALRRRNTWMKKPWTRRSLSGSTKRDPADTDLESTIPQDENVKPGSTSDATITEKSRGDNKPTAEETADAVYTARISIEGMTCGSCSGAITRGLQELPFVRIAEVDLMSNSAKVEFTGRQNKDSILEKIDDLGYEADLVDCTGHSLQPSVNKTTQRAVRFELSGMYCPKCPTNTVRAIQEAFGSTITILEEPSLKSPRITVQYSPSPPSLTIRDISKVINAVDPSCSGSLYHQVSVEMRSQIIRHKERNRILRHLFVTLLVAVPTFVIGIVYMSLVPAQNQTRQWFEQPIWAGNAMRIDWALFIMTTPSMFYGAGMFHLRALKEIWSLWRPGSSVPLLRRFYRFGSMNLLISAGTSVAYFASVAILILDATTSPQADGMNRKSTTYFDTVTFLTLFILVGRFLEAYSKAKTSDAVSMLAGLRPTSALLVEHDKQGNQKTTEISVDLLETGDTVVIPHGACPPADGAVAQEGPFLLDESSLTGESRTVKKSKGDEVFTGTVNIGDPFQIRVNEVGRQSMLDKIVDVVREGQAKRAPIERLADTLTGYFTPVITLLAVATWLIWLCLGQSGALPRGWLDVEKGGWAYWSVEFAIAVFVVACPCGIGLAAPTALFVGSGLAAKHGILVQGGGEAFQEASRVDTIVFDKTGTLTEGKTRVVEAEMLTHDMRITKPMALSITQALEEASTHPIAKAITTYCKTELHAQSIKNTTLLDVKEIPGRGMWGKFSITDDLEKIAFEFVIGNQDFLRSSELDGSAEKNSGSSTFQAPSPATNVFLSSVLSRYQSAGNSTAVLGMRLSTVEANQVAVDYAPIAVFAITDPLRTEARHVMESLRAQGLQIHLCTGDNWQTAQSIASQLAIPASNVRAGVLPGEKAQYIQEIQTSRPLRKVVAFVGDGTNDTPALTVADVSIALSHPNGGGSDIALSTSSFVLLNSDLGSILKLIKLSKRVFLRVKLNFAWAAVYNVFLLPVAAGVFFSVGATWGGNARGGFRLSPVWASVAMAGSSISVVLSSLALKLPELETGSLFAWARRSR